MDPQVSVPIENPTSPAAVAAPGPAEEPLEPCSVSQGFLVLPPNHTSPHARAPIVSFATSTAPASSRRATTGLGSAGTSPSEEEHPPQGSTNTRQSSDDVRIMFFILITDVTRRCASVLPYRL